MGFAQFSTAWCPIFCRRPGDGCPFGDWAVRLDSRSQEPRHPPGNALLFAMYKEPLRACSHCIFFGTGPVSLQLLLSGRWRRHCHLSVEASCRHVSPCMVFRQRESHGGQPRTSRALGPPPSFSCLPGPGVVLVRSPVMVQAAGNVKSGSPPVLDCSWVVGGCPCLNRSARTR